MTSPLAYKFDPPVVREIIRNRSFWGLDYEECSSFITSYAPSGDLVDILALAMGRDESQSPPLESAFDWSEPGTDDDGFLFKPFALDQTPPNPQSYGRSKRPTVKRRVRLVDRPYHPPKAAKK